MSENQKQGISPDVITEVTTFRDERQWKPFHNSKDLAISLSLEASELLEIFQWSADDVERPERRDELADELADVLIYAILLADHAHLNLDSIIRKKLKKNSLRYPVGRVTGLQEEYLALKALARKSARVNAGDDEELS